MSCACTKQASAFHRVSDAQAVQVHSVCEHICATICALCASNIGFYVLCTLCDTI